MATCTIVGGGIGGLTAALCLAAKGWQVEVLEQADAFSDVGAGIQLSPNAMAVFRSAFKPCFVPECIGPVRWHQKP